MATVRPRVMAMPPRQPGRLGRIVEFPLDMAEEDIITKVLQFIPDRDSHKAQLAFADIVVAGGLGLKSKAGSRQTGKSGRPAKRFVRSSTSRPVFPAQFSIAWVWRAPI
jgi:hypothetical protein